MNNRRWSLWIDIEGFGTFFRKEKARDLLAGLISDLYEIGCGGIRGLTIPDWKPIFAHQSGDGFIVGPTQDEHVSEWPLAIAVALMRACATRGGFARAAISYGEVEDVIWWLTPEIQGHLESDKGGIIRFQKPPGTMTIMPFLGTGLIRAHKLAEKHNLRGPQLLVSQELVSVQLGAETLKLLSNNTGVVIDWVRSEILLADGILKAIGVTTLDVECTLQSLQKYLDQNNVPTAWREGANFLLRGVAT